MYLYPRMTVVIELNILLLASRVGYLKKFSLEVFATSLMMALTFTVSKVELVFFRVQYIWSSARKKHLLHSADFW